MLKTSRKLKKEIKNTIITYDIASLPYDADVSQVLEIYHKSGFLFYDSKNGNKPGLYNKKISRVKSIDVNTLDGAISFHAQKRKL